MSQGSHFAAEWATVAQVRAIRSEEKKRWPWCSINMPFSDWDHIDTLLKRLEKHDAFRAAKMRIARTRKRLEKVKPCR